MEFAVYAVIIAGAIIAPRMLLAMLDRKVMPVPTERMRHIASHPFNK